MVDSSPRKAKDNDHIQKIADVAFAYYKQNATQQQIAQELNVSRSQVSRYLDQARELGIVNIDIVWPDSHNLEQEQRLKTAFPALRDAIVVPFSSKNLGEGDSLLGRTVANYIMDVLTDDMLLGIGGGRSVRSVVKWLKPTSKNITVIQTMGSTGSFAQGIDYTLLANEAAKNLKSSLWTINAPTVLWKNAGTVEDLMKTSNQLASVIRKSRNCDIYLLGVGAIGNDALFVQSGLLESSEIDVVRKAGAVGNICGVFFDSQGNECDTEFKDRIVGVHKDSLVKADYSILVGFGVEKVKAIIGALRGGIVNVLATDSETASLILQQNGD
jgi:deoxyribonucleoside regulator